MASARSEQPREVPSYARPTATSASRTSPRQASGQPPSPSVRRFPPHSPLRREVYRSFSLSTRASYLKARSHGHFRILDLPLELRERIYELVYPKWYRHRIALYDPILMNENWERLPALLRVNTQVREEAGRYLFSKHSFEFLISHDRIKCLFEWLKMIGAPNAERLFSNPRVSIRILHSQTEYQRTRSLDIRLRETNVISGPDALDVMSLREILDRVQMACPRTLAINKWTFASASPSEARRFLYSVQRANRPNRSSFDIVFSLATLAQIRSILLGAFRMAQGEDVDQLSDESGGEWLRADQRRSSVWRALLSQESGTRSRNLLIFA